MLPGAGVFAIQFLDGSVAIRLRVDSELSDEARFRVRGV